MSFELAIPLGNWGDRELRSNRADSGAPQQTAKIDARTCSSFLVTASMIETLLTRPSRSTCSSRAILFDNRVKLPVRTAFGNMEAGTLKIAPTSHPSIQCPQ